MHGYVWLTACIHKAKARTLARRIATLPVGGDTAAAQWQQNARPAHRQRSGSGSSGGGGGTAAAAMAAAVSGRARGGEMTADWRQRSGRIYAPRTVLYTDTVVTYSCLKMTESTWQLGS
eukprot:COSAG01_NODE_8239_length_2860_cov_2.088012_4_plen_119_part_00